MPFYLLVGQHWPFVQTFISCHPVCVQINGETRSSVSSGKLTELKMSEFVLLFHNLDECYGLVPFPSARISLSEGFYL